MTVAKAVLATSQANPVALEALAVAYDAADKTSDAAPVWVRLLATDSTNEDLIEKVVTALSREGNAKLAEPLIDAGSDLHADNLVLLKLRWLVHLAAKDWKGAIAARRAIGRSRSGNAGRS